jgi:uncharacterized RDD family membrane protein YckC
MTPPSRTVNSAQMVTVSFARGGQEFARIVLDNGQCVQSFGDVTWLDLSFAPYSERFGRPVRFTDDAEEWARSLPDAYAMEIKVTLTQTPPVTTAVPVDHLSLKAPGAPATNQAAPAQQAGARTYSQPAATDAWALARPLELAGWWTRVAAMLVDSLIIGIPAGGLSQALFGLHSWAARSSNGASAGILWDWKQILLGVALGFGYFVLRTTRKGAYNGQSVGKRALHIRIVRDDGEPVGLGTAVRRYGTLYGLSLLFGLGSLFDFLWPLSDSSNRALHDKAARTHVVSAAGQSRRNPAAVVVSAGIVYIVLIGVLIAVARPSFTGLERPTAAAQTAYVAASQMYIQAEQASGACAATADHSGPFSQPACLTAKVSALAVALGNLSTANSNAQSGLSAGPCATALSHEGQAIRAARAAVHNAVQALRAGDSAAFSQAQQQASAAQQAAASTEAQYPLSACSSTPGQSRAA